MKRISEKWVVEKPEDLSKWLYQNDGGDAVCIDDDANPKVTYCANVDLLMGYRDKGKPAFMFSILDRQLFDKENLGAQ